jgi:hypothetical protein
MITGSTYHHGVGQRPLFVLPRSFLLLLLTCSFPPRKRQKHLALSTRNVPKNRTVTYYRYMDGEEFNNNTLTSKITIGYLYEEHMSPSIFCRNYDIENSLFSRLTKFENSVSPFRTFIFSGPRIRVPIFLTPPSTSNQVMKYPLLYIPYLPTTRTSSHLTYALTDAITLNPSRPLTLTHSPTPSPSPSPSPPPAAPRPILFN